MKDDEIELLYIVVFGCVFACTVLLLPLIAWVVMDIPLPIGYYDKLKTTVLFLGIILILGVCAVRVLSSIEFKQIDELMELR